jgi:hypothetical protein
MTEVFMTILGLTPVTFITVFVCFILVDLATGCRLSRYVEGWLDRKLG